MERKVLQYALGALLVLATIAGAAARSDVIFDMNVPVYEAEAYVCENSDCSAVDSFTGSFPSGSRTTTGKLNISFPDNHPRHGYAVYLFAEGFVPNAYRFNNLPETSDFKQFNWPDHFVKVSNCKSKIDRLVVVNAVQKNQPVVVRMQVQADARTQSAFKVPASHPVQFIPDARKGGFYSSDVRVTFEVWNQNNALQERQVQTVSLYQGTDAPVQFTYTPTSSGLQRAVITTEVTDNQCEGTSPQSTSAEFSVHDRFARNEVYTVVNDLRALEERPETNQRVTLRYNKISNLANNLEATDANYRLTPVHTDVTHTVKNATGAVVFSEQRRLDPNLNERDPQDVEFSFVPATSGKYTVTVAAMGVLPAGVAGVPNDVSTRTLDVFVRAPGQFFVTFLFVDEHTPTKPVPFAVASMGGKTATADSQGRVTVGPFAPGEYDLEVTQSQYATLRTRVTVYEGDSTKMYAMRFVGGAAPAPGPGANGASLASAAQTPKEKPRAQFSRVEIPGGYDLLPGDSVDVYVSLENTGQKRLERTKVFVTIPDLGLRRVVGPFTLKTTDRRTAHVVLPLPSDVPPGVYYVKINVHNDDYSNTIWREIRVQ